MVCDFFADVVRIVQVFKDFCGNDDVELGEVPGAVEVEKFGFDAEFFGACKHLSVDINAGNVIAGKEVARECSVAAADVKDFFSGPYPGCEEFAAFIFEH